MYADKGKIKGSHHRNHEVAEDGVFGDGFAVGAQQAGDDHHGGGHGT